MPVGLYQGHPQAIGVDLPSFCMVEGLRIAEQRLFLNCHLFTGESQPNTITTQQIDMHER